MNVTDAVAVRVLECKMEISHIVTVGCSFTYCQGLNKPATEGWPALLANKLYTKVVNLGLPGVGNDNIHRRTYEYFYKNQAASDHNVKGVPLFVIAWSQPWRREAWFQNEFGNVPIYKDYGTVSLADNTAKNDYESALLANWNEEDFIRKTLLYKLSLQNLFKSNNIPYIMTDYMYQLTNSESNDRVVKKFPELISAVDAKHVAYPLYELTNDFTKLPCGHDGPDAQIAVASYLTQKIRETYPDAIFINKKYLTLTQYSKVDSYTRKFPVWFERV